MDMFGGGTPVQIGLDAQQIAAEFNYIKSETGTSDDVALNLLYNLWEKRKASFMPIERILDWPFQN